MKKALASFAVVFAFATAAFAHGGHIHSYMGTITMLHGNSEFVVQTTDGKEVTVHTSAKTRYLHSDDQAGRRSDLSVGKRVVVKMSEDGQTAASVKISSGNKSTEK